MKNKSTNQVVTFGMKMNPVSRFLTDETRNQNNDTMSNSEIEETTFDANGEREFNTQDEICRNDIFNTLQLEEVSNKMKTKLLCIYECISIQYNNKKQVFIDRLNQEKTVTQK